MILDSRNSLCPNLGSLDMQPGRTGEHPEIHVYLYRNGHKCDPALACAQVPLWCLGCRLELTVWLSEPMCLLCHPLRGENMIFSSSTGEGHCLRSTGCISPLTPHHAALWNSISLWSLGEGEAGREVPELSTWHSLNVRFCNLQVIWDSWEMQWESHSIPCLPCVIKLSVS